MSGAYSRNYVKQNSSMDIFGMYQNVYSNYSTEWLQTRVSIAIKIYKLGKHYWKIVCSKGFAFSIGE